MPCINIQDLSLLVAKIFFKDNDWFDLLFYEPFNKTTLSHSSDIAVIYEQYKYNYLSRCMFIVEDLDGFIKCIKSIIHKKGISVNQGSNKWRGQLNSLDNKLMTIDLDFINSIKRHINNHVNINHERYIKPHKLSYNNVHINIGQVRWHSTVNNRIGGSGISKVNHTKVS